jgi:23S rRNA (pseudouridine1915-N3)-methyltransferase
MRIHVFAVGRLKAGPEKELAERYFDRFAKTGPAVGLELTKITEISESRASSPDARKREEATALEKIITEGSILMLLDERGKTMGSPELADMIGGWRDQGKRELIVAIGGPDGLLPDLHQKAQGVISFGKMTWPHQMVRFMLAEQLYRTVTILSGHPYHRV